jgi:O-antigen/teichoic acid export membrane protein
MLAPAALLNSIGQQIQNLLFPLLFGAAAAGQFALASRVMSAPIGLTSKAIGNVFSGEAASQRNDAEALRHLTLHVLGLTTGCALPVFACAAVLAPSVFAWLFGAEWREAGMYAAILAAGLSASLIASPLSSLITLRDSLQTAIYFSSMEILVRSLPFIMGAIWQSERLAIILLSIGNVVLYIVALVRFLRLAHMHVIDYLRHTRKILLLALACFTPAFTLAAADASVAMKAAILLPGGALYGFGLAWYWRKGEI